MQNICNVNHNHRLIIVFLDSKNENIVIGIDSLILYFLFLMGGLNINLQELQNLYICIWKVFPIDKKVVMARKSDKNWKIGDFDCLP